MIGLAAAILIAGIAYRARALTVDGAVAAVVVGAIAFDLGGWSGAGALLTFFVTSTALGRWRSARKETVTTAKGQRRDAGQVLANGGAACLCLIAGRLAAHGHEPLAALIHARALTAFAASIAAANADTWATEIGAALGAPARLLSTLRLSRPGTSGAVSAPGTAAAVLGACVVAAWSPTHAALIAMAGLAGCFVDSLAGATVQGQWRDPSDPTRLTDRPPSPGARPERGHAWVNNDIVNAFCTGSAAVIAFAVG